MIEVVESQTEMVRGRMPSCPGKTEWRFYVVGKDGWVMDDFTSVEHFAAEYREKYKRRGMSHLVVVTQLPELPESDAELRAR